MRASAIAASVLCASILPTTASASSVPLLYLIPDLQTVAVGDTVEVGVWIKGVRSAGQEVAGFDLDVLFDSSVLADKGTNSIAYSAAQPLGAQDLTGCTGGYEFCLVTSVTPAGDYGAVGDSTLSQSDLQGKQSDDFLLYMMYFVAANNGSTWLDFGRDLSFERNVIDAGYNTLTLNYAGACVVVGTGGPCSVPEPSSYGLVGAALAGMFVAPALRRRRDKTA